MTMTSPWGQHLEVGVEISAFVCLSHSIRFWLKVRVELHKGLALSSFLQWWWTGLYDLRRKIVICSESREQVQESVKSMGYFSCCYGLSGPWEVFWVCFTRRMKPSVHGKKLFQVCAWQAIIVDCPDLVILTLQDHMEGYWPVVDGTFWGSLGIRTSVSHSWFICAARGYWILFRVVAVVCS